MPPKNELRRAEPQAPRPANGDTVERAGAEDARRASRFSQRRLGSQMPGGAAVKAQQYASIG
ncbi:MAG: hypothetical protein ABL955_10345 [Elusimicrobiota bacterium]